VHAESEVIKRTTAITERNLIAIETALMSTGLDYEALLTPVGNGPDGSPVHEGPIGGGPPIQPARTWVNPLAGPVRVLSPFGPRGGSHHDGVDYLAKVGTPVRAIADGEIIFTQSRANWEKRRKFIERDGKRIKSPAWRAGVYVEVQHDDGKVSRYMHLHHIADRIEKGARVRQRDVIGYVGRTAVEHSHTHLHFEVRQPPETGRYGPAINPATLLGAPDRPGVASSQLLPRIDPGRAPGGGQARREVEQKLRGLSLLEKMDRLEAIKALLNQLPMGAPVDNYRLSSTFGNRTDPKTGKPEFHPGVDIPGQLGTIIKATAPGKVISAGWKGLYGRVVEIDHGNGIRTRYGHLNQTLVRPGQQVSFNDRIGEMGDSGRSTGPHVHYEVLVNDEYEDPLNFLRAGRYIFKR
jgi:murein DD-endopeptidase MepM/ murein hydrolase activator NlpD